jgi:membrane protein implicated in regulation of membrane protease activity
MWTRRLWKIRAFGETLTRRSTDMQNGVQGMIGETALVTKVIAGAHHPGSVRARGENWLAIPLDPNETIETGSNVVVADIDRGLLVVYATDSS